MIYSIDGTVAELFFCMDMYVWVNITYQKYSFCSFC